MKKGNSSKASAVSKESGPLPADHSNVAARGESFTFSNGDRYEGGFAINGEPPFLVRQGRGIYDTDDFNRYEAIWERDKIGSDLHIRFNNGMEYKGGSDEDGCMSGSGIYRISDGSSIEAVWERNKPVLDIRYKEPLGYIWRGELSEDGNTVSFTAGNHFWNDMCVPSPLKSDDEAMTEVFGTSKVSEGSAVDLSRENSLTAKSHEEL